MKYRYSDPETGLTVERTIYFPRPKALIPAIDEAGEHLLCQWGRRDEKEDANTDAPVTGWARMESLEKQYWTRHEPSFVLIPALEFCEKPSGFKKSVWYPPMRPDTYLMGLRLEKAGKGFVYVVTHIPPSIFRDIDRVPVIVNREFEPQEPLEADFEAAAIALEPSLRKRKSGPGEQMGLFS